MPFINISTSKKVENKNKILEEIIKLISSLTNKSEKFVMAKLDNGAQMYFRDDKPCCFVEIKSIGSINTSKMVKPLSDFIYEKMGIPIDKIYISFEDIPPNMWGWNGTTFE